MLMQLKRRLTYANVMATLAMFVALGGGAYAAATIGSSDIKKRAVRAKHIKTSAVKGRQIKAGVVGTSELRDGAVTSGKIAGGTVGAGEIQDFSLRLRDLGGEVNAGTETVPAAFNVPDNGCIGRGLELFNPAPPGVIGSVVVGHLTDSQGGAVLDNGGFVVPTMISETSQGGAIANLMVCSFGGAQAVPAGSVFRYQLIGP